MNFVNDKLKTTVSAPNLPTLLLKALQAFEQSSTNKYTKIMLHILAHSVTKINNSFFSCLIIFITDGEERFSKVIRL